MAKSSVHLLKLTQKSIENSYTENKMKFKIGNGVTEISTLTSTPNSFDKLLIVKNKLSLATEEKKKICKTFIKNCCKSKYSIENMKEKHTHKKNQFNHK